MKSIIFILTAFLFFQISIAQNKNSKIKVFTLEVKAEIDPRTNRYIKLALEEATEKKADLVIMEINTFGGALKDADEIRQRVLEFPKPIYVFVNKNAASAGALISIACDKIYMTNGANIGAATVVNGNDGSAAPDKYQSYMRSLMRSTAEVNKRDPKIAEGMVDEDMEIDSLKPFGKVLTLTTSEAIRLGYCEGEVKSIQEILQKNNIKNYELEAYVLPVSEQIISFVLNPFISGILLLLIIEGLYFEFQSPGLAFPIIISLSALALYLIPYYLNGLAANWEILVFIAGIILLALEIFVIPGFGVTGISGIILIFASLILMMVPNDYFNFDKVLPNQVVSSFVTVGFSMFASVALIFIGGKKLIESRRFKKLTNQHTLQSSSGYTSNFNVENMIGLEGVAFTVLRPSGKIMVNSTIYDASTRGDFIDKGTPVIITSQEGTSVKVKRIQGA